MPDDEPESESVAEPTAADEAPAYHDPEWLREKYISMNMSQREIAELCGVSRSRVDKHLRKHDITKPRLLRNINLGVNDYESAVKRDLKPVTNESVVIIQSSHGGTGRRFHAFADGEPACGTNLNRNCDDPNSDHLDETESDVWPVEKAQRWASPCRYCYLHTTPGGEPADAGGNGDGGGA